MLANSDSEGDQALKLRVRDTVTETAAGLFDTAGDAGEALEVAEDQLPALLAAAQQRVYDEGYDYPVNAELTRMYLYHPHLRHGHPAGGHVRRGADHHRRGRRKNWWCVVFPPICVPAAAEHKDLSDVLDEDQVDIVTQPQKYEVKFKIVEWWEGLSHRLGEWFGGGGGIVRAGILRCGRGLKRAGEPDDRLRYKKAVKMVIGQHGIGEKRQEGPAWITRGLSCLTADLRLGSSPMMYPLFLPALFTGERCGILEESSEINGGGRL